MIFNIHESGHSTKSLVVVVLSVVFCLVVLEGAIRVYSALFFPRMMLLDQTLGWRQAANVSKIFVNEFGERTLTVQNEYGHQGKTYPLAKTPGRGIGC